MPFDLGALTSGFTGGADAMMGVLAKRRALQEQARVQAAQRAIAQGQINAAGAGGGGGGAPAMTSVPIPGATPMPPPSLAPSLPPPPPFGAAQPRGGAPMTGAALGPRGGLPPAAMLRPGASPAPQPSSPGAPPAAAKPQASQPPAFSGVAQSTGDLTQDSTQTVNRVFQELIRQNPALRKDPQTLFTAAEQQIGLMKGVNSDLRTMMQMQLGAQKLAYSYDSLADRHDKWVQQQQTQLQMLDQRLQDKSLDRQTRVVLQRMRDETMSSIAADRVAATERGQDIGLERSREGYDAAADRTEALIEERGREADNRDAETQHRTDVGGLGLDPKNPTAAPQLRSRRPAQLQRRGQGAAKPAPAGASGAAARIPPEAVKHLKKGVVTTFGNGQRWTLDANGRPKQVS